MYEPIDAYNHVEHNLLWQFHNRNSFNFFYLFKMSSHDKNKKLLWNLSLLCSWWRCNTFYQYLLPRLLFLLKLLKQRNKETKSIKQAIQLVFNGHLISTNFTFYRRKEYARTENNSIWWFWERVRKILTKPWSE